jgi:hypothetical protein
MRFAHYLAVMVACWVLAAAAVIGVRVNEYGYPFD